MCLFSDSEICTVTGPKYNLQRAGATGDLYLISMFKSFVGGNMGLIIKIVSNKLNWPLFI